MPYIPRNLELAELVGRCPIQESAPAIRDKVIYILNLIMHLSDNPKNKDEWMVPIYAPSLRAAIGLNYRRFLDFLVEQEVLDEDHTYSEGRSRQFQLTDPYLYSDLVPVEIQSWPIRRRLKALLGTQRKAVGQFKFLVECLENLQLDPRAWDYWCKDSRRRWGQWIAKKRISLPTKTPRPKRGELGIWAERYVRTFYKKPRTYRMRIQRQLLALQSRNFTYTFSGRDGRFHSNLTCMKKEYRNFLSCQGEPIEEIDLSNSQPYFSLLLLRPEFWDNQQHGDLINQAKFKHSPNQNPFNHPHISKSFITKTFEKVSEIQDSADFQQYRNNVLSGDLYKHFQRELIERQQIVDEDGDPLIPEYKWYRLMEPGEVKAMFFFILFSKNKDTSEPKALFEELYPSVYEVFRLIKQYDHTLLSVLLQRIEATLVLDRITRRVIKEQPLMRLYTIHDALATTVGNAEYLEQVLKEEAIAATGYQPMFKRKTWSVNNLGYQ